MAIPKGKLSKYNQDMEIRRSKEFIDYVLETSKKMKSVSRVTQLAAKKFNIPVHRSYVNKILGFGHVVGVEDND
jgi:hypothetical protein